MHAINLFPILSEYDINRLFMMSKVLWTYLHEGRTYDLNVSDAGVISDADKQYAFWEPNGHDINYSFTITLNEPCNLFGGGAKAVACHDAKIGVATLWHSQSSFQRGVIKHAEITNSADPIELAVSGCLPKGQFRESVSIEVILYISQPGNPGPDEIHLANHRGCVLGSLYSRTLVIDGDGTIFPTAYVQSGKKAPLWNIQCNWDDPMTDKFVDSVRLNINMDNPMFKYLYNDKDNPDFSHSLLQEVVASALTIIVEKLRYEGVEVEDIDRCNPYEGSVLMMVKYLSVQHGCNFANPQIASEEIHKMVENTLN